MFLPLYPDGAVYHWPIATILLIVTNVIVYPIQHSLPSSGFETIEVDPDDFSDVPIVEFEEMEKNENGNYEFIALKPGWRDWALSFGDGLHPIQWITAMFLHTDAGHLIGNMVFLWIFGILVEGRVGSLLFIGLYLLMGVLQSAIWQVLFLMNGTGCALGASGAIYSLLLLGMVWMPQDNVKCLWLIYIYFFFTDIPMLMFGLFYVLWDFGIALFSGFEMGTAFLHVGGAAVGLVFALAGLRFRWFETENRDLWSMFQEARGKELVKRPKPKTPAEIREENQQKLDAERKLASLWRSIDVHLEAGNARAAVGQMYSLRRLLPKTSWDESRLLRLISAANKTRDGELVLQLGQEYLDRFDTRQAQQIRLLMAKILGVDQSHPRKALKLLKPIVANMLDDKQRDQMQKLIALCQKKIDDGEIEFE